MSLVKVALHNLYFAVICVRPSLEDFNDFVLTPMTPYTAFKAILLFKKTFRGKSYGFFRSLFMIFIGHRFSFCLIDKEKDRMVVGFQFLRISQRDIKANAIHESYIAIHPEYTDRGLATKLRQYSSKSMLLSGLSGISSRIELTNLGSIRSATNIGYEIKEEYVNQMGEREVYLILPLEKNRETQL